MARRKNIRTTVDTDAKSGHLNCLDLDQHRTRESNLQRKAREDAIFENSADVRPVSKFRFPSLGGGLNFNRGLNLISGPEMAELHQRLRKERNFYRGRKKTKDGWRLGKKRFKQPLQQLTVTVRPDFALALEFCERDKRDDLVREFLTKQLLPGLVQEFEMRTDLEIISLHVHPEEGCLHLHMVFSTISRTHELLWRRDSVGRHGLRLLNISHTGTLRLIRGGFLGEEIGKFARHDLADRMKLSGEEPIDWVLSKAVDDYCTVLFSETELAPTYQKAREEYHAGLLKRMAEKPKALALEKKRMGGALQVFTEKFEKERNTLEEAQAEIERLKEELARVRRASSAMDVPRANAGGRSGLSPANKLVDRLNDAPEVPPACLHRSGMNLAEVLQEIKDEGGDVEAFALWGIKNHRRFIPEELRLLKIYVPEVEEARDAAELASGEYPDAGADLGERGPQ